MLVFFCLFVCFFVVVAFVVVCLFVLMWWFLNSGYSSGIWTLQTVLLKNLKLNWCSFSTVLSAPILSVSSPSYDSIAVSWKAVYMAVGFSVSLMRSDGLGRMLKQNTTNTSFIFSNLDPGTLYTIKAYAWNANGLPGDDFTYNQRTSKKFSFLKLCKHFIGRYTKKYLCTYSYVMFF